MKEYLRKPIEKEKVSLKFFYTIIKNFFILLIHATWFHKPPSDPDKFLPKIHKGNDFDYLYQFCEKIYTSSLQRIKDAEEKAHKLLAYVTVLLAFFYFLFHYANTENSAILISATLSAALLFWAFFLILRCLNIKSRMEIFIDDIYDFQKKYPAQKFSRKDQAKSYLNNALFNNNVADNSIDILRAARSIIALSVFSMLMFLLLSLSKSNNDANSLSVLLKQTSEIITYSTRDILLLNKSEELASHSTILEEKIQTLEQDFFCSTPKYREI